MSKEAPKSAWAELFERYRAVFAHAWRERHQLTPPQRQPHEAQFLPAALELQETPVSPAPRITAWVLMTFALLALVWALVGQIDVVATARGKIIPVEGSKWIQPMETATIQAIHVVEGQAVQAGQRLIELDATQANADVKRLNEELLTARLHAHRMRAMLQAIDQGVRPHLDATDEALREVDATRLAQEQRVLLGQYDEFRAKWERLLTEGQRREAEMRTTLQSVRKLEQTLPIVEQRAQDFQGLVGQNFVSQHAYLEREQQRIEMKADLASHQSRFSELDAALRAVLNEQTTLLAETRRQTLESMSEAHRQMATIEQEWLKADVRSRWLTLHAPVDGVVQQLAVQTVGGVVTPAQVLMVVVPKEAPLQVEAWLENKDVGFVAADQTAHVKVDAYPYTKFGTIDAQVIHVSKDAIAQENLGLVFSVRARLSKSDLALSPGMSVAVEIKTGKRRVIEYFLTPFLEYKAESLRER